MVVKHNFEVSNKYTANFLKATSALEGINIGDISFKCPVRTNQVNCFNQLNIDRAIALMEHKFIFDKIGEYTIYL